MTISEADREHYQSVVSDFVPQHVPDSCLPTALRNISKELSERHDVSEIKLGLNELNDICDYREHMGSSSEFIPSRLDEELAPYGYTAKCMVNMELSELDRVIESGRNSYPIVELDPEYFNSIENWDPRAGSDGYQWPHIVVPFKVNTNRVLFYDPFEKMMTRSGRVSEPQSELPKAQFYEFWSGQAQPRWTLWIDKKQQTTLDQIEEMG